MEEKQDGIGTTVIVIGGVGCLLVLLVLVAGLFLAGVSVDHMESTSVVIDGQLVDTVTERRELGNGEWVEATSTSKDGVRVERVLRRSTANGIVETRAIWGEDGVLDPEASGKFEAGQRVRALTPEEIEEIEGF